MSTPRLNVLVSYATLGDRCVDMLRPDWDVLLDSGAFTNFKAGKDVVTMDSYCKFLEQHGSRFWRYMSLDRIGDAPGSRANLIELRRRGFSPVPVFQRTAPLHELEEMASQSDLVAIGGIAGGAALPGRSEKREYVEAAMAQTRRLGVNAHLLGVGSFATLVANRPFSADSSDYCKGNRYGELRLWEPRARQFVFFRRTRSPVLTRAMAKLLDSYQATPENLKDQKWWGRGALRISALSTFQFSEHMARLGTKYFLATMGTDRLGDIWDEFVAARAA